MRLLSACRRCRVALAKKWNETRKGVQRQLKKFNRITCWFTSQTAGEQAEFSFACLLPLIHIFMRINNFQTFLFLFLSISHLPTEAFDSPLSWGIFKCQLFFRSNRFFSCPNKRRTSDIQMWHFPSNFGASNNWVGRLKVLPSCETELRAVIYGAAPANQVKGDK